MIKYLDESIFIDFEYIDGVIEPEYRAFYSIKDIEKKVVKTAELDRSDDNTTFELRIKSGELEELKPGNYKLEVSVENDEIGYKDYIYNEDLILRS